MKKHSHLIGKTSLLILAAGTTWLSGCAVAPGDSTEDVAQTEEPVLHGYILDEYNKLGGASGQLGAALPPVEEQVTAFNQGVYNLFQNGVILYKWNDTKAVAVFKNFYDTFKKLGNEWGSLGFPVTDQYAFGDRTKQDFENARLYYKNGFSWPFMLVYQANFANLQTMGWARLSGGSLPALDQVQGTCLRNVSGAGFTPGATVNFYINSTTSSAFIFSKTADSSGSFSNYNQPPPSGHAACFDGNAIKKFNNLATIEARDATHRAVLTVSTALGNNVTP